MLLKSFTEDKDRQAAGSIEQSETETKRREVSAQQRAKIMVMDKHSEHVLREAKERSEGLTDLRRVV